MTPPAPVSPLPVDTQSMWEVTASLPDQVMAALGAAQAVELAVDRPITNVVALGMGGSGIAGDVLAAYAAPELPVPVTVVKGYELPAFVGADSLVFAVSCSGNTEETVSAATAAWSAGATVVTVAGGGELTRLAKEAGSPVVPVPTDIPQPRAAIGAMATPPLVILERLGLLDGVGERVSAAVDQLRRRRDESLGAGSLAQDVARRIGRTLPLVHGSPGLTAVAASRWKTQVNENAKSPAFFAQQPELCHNEICGWGQQGDVTRQMLSLVTLRHDQELGQIARRFEIVGELMEEVMADIIEVRAAGTGALAQFFDLVLVGDFVSLHLAGKEGIDPGPVPVLVEMKDRLKS